MKTIVSTKLHPNRRPAGRSKDDGGALGILDAILKFLLLFSVFPFEIILFAIHIANTVEEAQTPILGVKTMAVHFQFSLPLLLPQLWTYLRTR
ncbi:hypothetical protein SLA2020_057300 [Shorea laevis]